MSSEHSPAKSNASQEDVWNIIDNNMAPLISNVQESSNENMAETGPDGQSVPANEVVTESNPMLMRETMTSMLELLIHQQEVRAKAEARIAEQRAEVEARMAEQRAEEARMRAAEAEQTRMILYKMAQVLSGNESTESPMVNMEKTSYIGVEMKKTSYPLLFWIYWRLLSREPESGISGILTWLRCYGLYVI